MTKDSARVRAALLDPASVFGSPEEVERDGTLSQEEKLAILGSWEEDAHELAVAEDESMGGGEPSRLDGGGGRPCPPDGCRGTSRAGAKEGRREARVREDARAPLRPTGARDHPCRSGDGRGGAQAVATGAPGACRSPTATRSSASWRARSLRGPREEQNRDVRITARVMMTTDLAFCYLDDDVTTARALMDKHGCNHLMVVDREQVLVGTLERDDLPAASARETQSLQERPEVVERARGARAGGREHHPAGRPRCLRRTPDDQGAARLTSRCRQRRCRLRRPWARKARALEWAWAACA